MELVSLNGFKIDYVENRIFGSAAFFSSLSLNLFLHPFLNQNFSKKFLDTKKFHFRRPIFTHLQLHYFWWEKLLKIEIISE